MAEFLDYVALLLRALTFMPWLQALLLGLGAVLSGIAVGRLARVFRVSPFLAMRRILHRKMSSDHRHAAVHMHRGAGQIARFR